MTEQKECQSKCESKKCCKGKSAVALLVVLVLAAVGVLAYMSGKMGGMPMSSGSDEAKTEETAQGGEAKVLDPKHVLAKVDGKDITVADVTAMIQMLPQHMKQLPPEQLLPMALEQAINNEVISGQANKAGLESDPDVKSQLEFAKNQIVRAKFVENEVSKEVNDDSLKAEYTEYLKNFPDVEEVHASHILVDDEAAAKDIVAKLGKGESFEELAKSSSKDGSAENGGDLGYFAKNEVVAEFAEAAFSTPVGEYTKTPVKSEFGYHVIKVQEKRKRPPAAFEEAKPYIEQELRRKAVEKVIAELRRNAVIEHFDEKGNPLPQSEPAAGADDGKDSGEAASTEPSSAEAPEAAAPVSEASDAGSDKSAAPPAE